jgi:23S rRNA (cytidine1920-2'-O)/16S rRNA (cytidine1409-2'-O)-methyltransferase
MQKRLDQLLLDRQLATDLAHAAALVMAHQVQVNQQLITKPGTLVDDQAQVAVNFGPQYVSRGGHKLAAALTAFNINVAGRICADVGASTGGFSDVLLQNHAQRVYAIDVSYGVLAWPIRQNPRVVVMERTNARHLEHLPEPVSLVVGDVSFISLKQILPAMQKWVAPTADFIVLIKPQFEAPKHLVEPGGVVTDSAHHQTIARQLMHWASQRHLQALGLIPSPLLGPAGNREFLLHLTITPATTAPSIDQLISTCFQQ